jgi:hypothetical protein
VKATGIALLSLLLVGCGALAGPVVLSEGTPVEDPYDGPLYLRVSQPDHRNFLVRAGAAGRVIQCSGDPYSGSTGSNWGVPEGLATSAKALEAFIRDQAGPPIPAAGYRLERETQDRVLFTYDVSGDTKVAVIVAKNSDGTSGEDGWSMETFAQCDPAELPDAVTEELDIDVWVNEQGERVPVTVISSGQGPEHCDWDSATFLDLRGDTFVKDPEGVLPSEYVNGTFVPDTSLPADANDTGYRLDAQQLWVGADGSAAFIVTEEGVERWPAADEALGCA